MPVSSQRAARAKRKLRTLYAAGPLLNLPKEAMIVLASLTHIPDPDELPLEVPDRPAA